MEQERYEVRRENSRIGAVFFLFDKKRRVLLDGPMLGQSVADGTARALNLHSDVDICSYCLQPFTRPFIEKVEYDRKLYDVACYGLLVRLGEIKESEGNHE